MNEKEFELAEKLTEAIRENAIYEAQQRAKPETHPDFDGKHCVECDVEIPGERLLLGKVRCVHCQTVRERKLGG